MPKVIAITGATGFIGRRLVERHLAAGNEVRFLTRNPHSLSTFAGATGYLGDLTKPEKSMQDFVQDVDVLYHLSAELLDPSRMWEVNVDGTRNLLEIAAPRVDKWIQLSSTGVYGAKDNALITELSPIVPNNSYEKSKAEADRLVTEFSASRSLPAIVLRPSTVYGPGMPNQSLFQLISVINRGLFFFVGKPGATTNYVHVENVVDALMLCADAPITNKLVTYIVSDYCSLEELVEVIALESGRPVPKMRLPTSLARSLAAIGEKVPGIPLKQSRVDALTGRVVYSSLLISEELGYRNRISMQEGFKELVLAWKKSHA